MHWKAGARSNPPRENIFSEAVADDSESDTPSDQARDECCDLVVRVGKGCCLFPNALLADSLNSSRVDCASQRLRNLRQCVGKG